jgi:hypothetical protein
MHSFFKYILCRSRRLCGSQSGSLYIIVSIVFKMAPFLPTQSKTQHHGWEDDEPKDMAVVARHGAVLAVGSPHICCNAMCWAIRNVAAGDSSLEVRAMDTRG